jgi:hypothetical protein
LIKLKNVLPSAGIDTRIAYASEIIRGGIISIPKGQTEAAYSIGMTYRQTIISATKINPNNDVSLIKLKNVLPSAGIDTRIACGKMMRLLV